MPKSIYVAGSLANPRIPEIAMALRAAGYDAFDAWYSSGPEADKCWQAHETQKGSTYAEALKGHAAQNTYLFDRKHLARCDMTLLVLPAGKSGHLELGWVLGRGKPGYILLDGPVEKYDVMYNFATGVVETLDEFLGLLEKQ